LATVPIDASPPLPRFTTNAVACPTRAITTKASPPRISPVPHPRTTAPNGDDPWVAQGGSGGAYSGVETSFTSDRWWSMGSLQDRASPGSGTDEARPSAELHADPSSIRLIVSIPCVLEVVSLERAATFALPGQVGRAARRD
jgi:hypothetical protein